MKVDAEAFTALGALCMQFGKVDRITYHPDGTPESDTDHTVMLGILATAFAEAHLPELDLGMVAQFALVHDFIEVYAGDTPTLRLTAAIAADKKKREDAAFKRISVEYAASYAWLPAMILLYETRELPEARYVKAMDKMLPKITHILNHGRTIREEGMSWDDVQERYSRQREELLSYAADFPALFDLRDALTSMVFKELELKL